MKALGNNARFSLVSAAGLALSAAAWGQTYSIQELRPLPGGNVSYAYGISPAGVVCGQSQDGSGQFPATRWVNGAPESLGNLAPYQASVGWGVNDGGQVVGVSYASQDFFSGIPFVWENDVMSPLPTGGKSRGIALAINDNGVIAGAVWNTNYYTDGLPCLWHHDQGQWQIQTLPTLGSAGFFATCINNHDVACGYAGNSGHGAACLWTSGSASPVGCAPANAGATAAWCVNDAGQVALGYLVLDTAGQALWGGSVLNDHGNCSDLGELPGFQTLAAYRINIAGTIVGHAYNGNAGNIFGSFTDSRAFVWRSGQLNALNDLLSTGGWDVRQVWDINQSGQVSGFGTHNGVWRALIATPCYANCDSSTTAPVLNVNDFICFQSKFAAGDTYANCDGSTTPPVLNVNDFICFQTKFAAGCP
jgi:uncharacterized membrane protein